MIRLRTLLPALSVLALAACGGGSSTDFIGAPPPSYDGTWTGSATRSVGGERSCPSPTPIVVTIENGVARGEVRSRRDRTVTVARFDGVIDADGRLVARAWYDSVRNDLSVQYNGERFAGGITNTNECTYSLRLARG